MSGVLLASVSLWLPGVIAFWLPDRARVEMVGRFGWQHGQLKLPLLRYWQGNCLLVSLDGAVLGRNNGRWLLQATTVRIDSPCLNNIPSRESNQPARTLSGWQHLLPTAQLDIDKVIVTPWQDWAGSVHLTLDPRQQVLHYSGDKLNLGARIAGRELIIQHLTLPLVGASQPLTLQGALQLSQIPDALPEKGELTGRVQVNNPSPPLTISLKWQHQQGELNVSTAGEGNALLQLPWQADNTRIRIANGLWQWPLAGQLLSGGVALEIDNWQKGLGQALLSGRLNVRTNGRGGRGNVVISFGPGKPDWQNSQIPLQITGDSKLTNLQFFASLPGELRGPILDPAIYFSPGALMRMRGRLLSTLEVDEARLPLAGVQLSSAGISGRLQAILSARDPSMGDFRMHLDGGAHNFWPDNGLWRWRYWGQGQMKPLAASWDVKGRGSWQDTQIALESLSTGFDKLSYGAVNVNAPRLTLDEPVRWQRDPEHPSLNGSFKLDARETRFSYGGLLPDSHLALTLTGRDPAWFQWRGTLQAGDMGPVQVSGRWDGQRLRGQAWWPAQSLRVFQPLLSPNLKMRIQDGTLRAQAAFSAATGQGFQAGGHFVVGNGYARMPDNEIQGVNFSLPFRFKQQQWYFGAKGPVELRIAGIKNQFDLKNITADLQGWYPWKRQQPLRLSNVNVDLMDGKLSMASLVMPQQEAANVRLTHISLSKFVTALNPKQFALSGYVNGMLPLWLNDRQWLVHNGWIANEGPLTLRLDKDTADAISSNNMVAGAAMDWLRYMEISRSWATIDLNNLGWLKMTAQVDGASQFSDRKQRVSLHYTHRENLFQLWRSLRFGDNLQSWVENNASLPSQKDASDDK
ncbi:YdbH family protein [Izhakiella capsodis]|nr:YdbH family protein [Izhakiella capsodis]